MIFFCPIIIYFILQTRNAVMFSGFFDIFKKCFLNDESRIDNDYEVQF